MSNTNTTLKPLKYYLIKYTFFGNPGEVYEEPTAEIDFSGVPLSAPDPITKEQSLLNGLYLAELIEENDITPDQLPLVKVNGDLTIFTAR